MLREMCSVVFRSVSGKIGLALLLLLVGGSVYVWTTYPHNFGESVWGNPAYWADNPKLAPPSWTGGKTKHQVVTDSSPDVQENGSGKVLTYRFHISLAKAADPDFLSFSVSDVSFWRDAPVIEVSFENGTNSIFLSRYFVPSRDTGESVPARRYKLEPFRTLLTEDAETADTVKMYLSSLRQNGKLSFDAVVKMTLGDTRDKVASIRFVAGGETFGFLGTDNIGRDLWQGLMFGLPISLTIGLVVAFFSTLIGAVLGGISGYVGGKTDTLLQRFIDLMTTVPVLPILIFLIFAFGSHMSYVVLFLIVFGWTGLTIQLRPWIMQIRESGFIALAKARGYSGQRIILRHLLPQTLPFLVANFVLSIPAAILAEAGLSFLGLGDPSLPTWGYMLQQGFQTGALSNGYWWWVLPPGIAVFVASLTFFLIYYPLESYIEPRLRKE